MARDMKGTDGQSIQSEITGNLTLQTQEQLDITKLFQLQTNLKSLAKLL
ncbi:hypothetical protein [Lactococcus lactis]